MGTQQLITAAWSNNSASTWTLLAIDNVTNAGSYVIGQIHVVPISNWTGFMILYTKSIDGSLGNYTLNTKAVLEQGRVPTAINVPTPVLDLLSFDERLFGVDCFRSDECFICFDMTVALSTSTSCTFFQPLSLASTYVFPAGRPFVSGGVTHKTLVAASSISVTNELVFLLVWIVPLPSVDSELRFRFATVSPPRISVVYEAEAVLAGRPSSSVDFPSVSCLLNSTCLVSFDFYPQGGVKRSQQVGPIDRQVNYTRINAKPPLAVLAGGEIAERSSIDYIIVSSASALFDNSTFLVVAFNASSSLFNYYLKSDSNLGVGVASPFVPIGAPSYGTSVSITSTGPETWLLIYWDESPYLAFSVLGLGAPFPIPTAPIVPSPFASSPTTSLPAPSAVSASPTTSLSPSTPSNTPPILGLPSPSASNVSLPTTPGGCFPPQPPPIEGVDPICFSGNWTYPTQSNFTSNIPISVPVILFGNVSASGSIIIYSTITVTGNLVFSPTTQIEVTTSNLTQPILSASGTLTLSGILQLTVSTESGRIIIADASSLYGRFDRVEVDDGDGRACTTVTHEEVYTESTLVVIWSPHDDCSPIEGLNSGEFIGVCVAILIGGILLIAAIIIGASPGIRKKICKPQDRI